MSRPRFKTLEDSEIDLKPDKVDKDKLTVFATGIHVKSKQQKEKEAAELKQKQEDEEAARAYLDFVEAFEGSGGNDKKRVQAPAFVRAGAAPSERPREVVRAPTASSSTTKRPAFDEEDIAPSVAIRKKRQMDSFLDELKRDQKSREDRLRSRMNDTGASLSALAAQEAHMGADGFADPMTTNLHLGNLPPHLNEEVLGHFAAKQVGPVGTVKIMWPRSDEFVVHSGMLGQSSKRAQGLNGFVAFMDRKTAERGQEFFEGYEWDDYTIRTGWGKSMPLPSRPKYYHVPAQMPEKSSRSGRFRSTSPAYRRSRSPPARKTQRVWPKIDRRTEDFLVDLADEIQDRGTKFERLVRERETDNPRYAFLRDFQDPAYHFFKMLLDRDYRPPSPPPRPFTDEGAADVYTTDSEEEEERELRKRDSKLGKLSRRRLDANLRSLTLTRGRIARCMAFAMRHTEMAEEVAEIICRSLMIDETPIPRKLSRLHLVSDILHNSSAPIHNAWKYRQAFETRLAQVFDHLNLIYQSFPGRMKAEVFLRQILSILEVWETWIVFPPAVMLEYRDRLVNGDAGIADNFDELQDDEDGAEIDYSSAEPIKGFKRLESGAIMASVDGDPVGDKASPEVVDLVSEDVAEADAEYAELYGVSPALPAPLPISADQPQDEAPAPILAPTFSVKLGIKKR
ncbi:uncharacterized protein L969DRAFT_94591 [Mixia osmundae IAM 14324]|uniref:SURP motif domain-containing protein n=1 Tax=Mixia osmundae (strain CBS 9802 / IAM 14324 / JCM 22182 / KY 12970) TaxID=764103 RepID=G7DVL1_MIXOS|nr:uncharacterized protein L969DRAFT_94591 [Mixia osmundae IAM 14324]KEI39535.1 hypothetical protein L969DRAFT_94591 [Mixia osmundae IAM 14324]GAA94621.1 hypothetical protein E5Q_01273 [Mixia osmundae IAM 14324]